MSRWVRIGRADVPGGGGVIDLLQDGDAFAIHVDGRQLMDSRIHGSEDALAELAAARVRDRGTAAFLIGGLGMGFTLAAAVRALGPEARITQVELVPEIVAWHGGVLGRIAGHPLRDPRVTVQIADVGSVIRAERDAFDAILLDVDNGPEGLTRPSNDRLYTPDGLDAAFDALRPDGILAVWSGWPDAGFTRRLRRAGFEVEEVVVRARGHAGGREHTIWLGRRPATDRQGWRAR
jgi:spermidine synthase